MTKDRKIVIFIILILMYIAAVTIYLMRIDITKNIREVYMVSAVSLAVMVVSALGFYIKIKRTKMINMLNDEYKLLYRGVSDYIEGSNLLINEKKDAHNMILDLFVTSQTNKRSADEVVRDPEDFSRTIVEAYGKVNIYLDNLLLGFYSLLSYLFAFKLIMFLTEGVDLSITGFYEFTVDGAIIMLYSSFIFVSIPLYLIITKKLSFTDKKVFNLLYSVPLLFPLIILVLLLLSNGPLSQSWFGNLADTEYHLFNSTLQSAVIIGLAFASYKARKIIKKAEINKYF